MTDYSNILSRRTAAVEEAATLRMAQKARDLGARGIDVVNLTIGEPDFDTPRHIKDAAVRALEEGHTHYGPVAGLAELREALAEKLSAENGLGYQPAEIALANGAKQALTNACFALLDPGEEAILLAPFWAAYEGIVRLAGGSPVVVGAGFDTDFKARPERIEQAITPRTKLLFLNTPCNPSGAVWSRAELEALARMLSRHPRVVVLADEIYEYIHFGERPASMAGVDGMWARTVTVNGFSKGFAMTGWRLGYAAAPEPIARAIAKVQGTVSAGANAFVQRAALHALQAGRGECERMREAYRRRRGLVVEMLRAVPGVRIHSPMGAFYAFPQVAACYGKAAGNRSIGNSVDLADFLLEEHHVAIVPGVAFGDDNCIRLSFAAGEAELQRGCQRIGEALARLR